MSRSLRLWIGTLVGVALIGFAVFVLVIEVSFGFQAVPTTALVDSYVARTNIFGRGNANVIHDVNGQSVTATLQTWFFLRPSAGERVAVLYVPAEPGRVEMDSLLQRYGPVALPLLLAIGVAYWAGLIRLRATQSGGHVSGAEVGAATQQAAADYGRDPGT